MKKVFILLSVFIAITTQGMAQKYIDVYQNGKVAGSMFSSDVDSISITDINASSRCINFWRMGELERSFIIADVDSIKVFHSEDEPLAYLGILGFNQELYIKPIDILASSTSSLYNDFVNNLTRKDGTLLYYGVDSALDLLTQYEFTTPLSSVNLITFTDGLDQGSMMMNTNFKNEEEYLSYLSQRIGSTYVRGLPLTAYCLGLKGSDVTNYTQFLSNLRHLATSDDKAIEVSSMSDVNNQLQKIADQIVSICNRQTISMKMPGQSDETRVRFTFDGKTPENSLMYIDGIFNLADRTLRGITYRGIRSATGNMVEGSQEGIFVTYTFTGLQRLDGNGLIPTNNIRQYNLAKGSTSWQINSEFTSANIQASVSHSSSAIMLVLDCSSSLGSQFSNMQYYAKDFIIRVANNMASFSISSPSSIVVSLDEEWGVNVSWDAVKYAECYSVYRSANSSSDFIKVADSLKITSWRDEDPLQGSNYYRVYAMGHGMTSTTGITSDEVACKISAPANVMASLDEEWGVNVSWDAVKYAECYSVYRSANSSSDFIKVADSLKITSWRDEDPLQGSNYYRVYAMGHGMTSTTSDSSVEVVCKISAPINVMASLDEEWGVNVSWDAVKYAECYSVYRSAKSNYNFIKVADSLSITSWRDEDPLQGSNYYRVYAMGHGMTSTTSDSSDEVVCKISAPTNVVASIDEEWGVNVSWDAVKYAECYSVYRSAKSNSDFTLVADSLKNNFWRDTAPLFGSNYYRVYAMGHGMTSTVSQTSNVVEKPYCPDSNHPHLIDLGLPSGIKWACCNIDTDHPENQSPTNFGGYYAWGETETKSLYNWGTYVHCDGYSNTIHNLGSNIANTQYDVAHVKWGGKWKMPTYEQFQELINNCTFNLTTEDGVWVGKFTSIINGSVIIMPAAGYFDDSDIYYVSNGYYWSSTQDPSDLARAYHLHFFSNGTSTSNNYLRRFGLSVRPVSY